MLPFFYSASKFPLQPPSRRRGKNMRKKRRSTTAPWRSCSTCQRRRRSRSSRRYSRLPAWTPHSPSSSLPMQKRNMQRWKHAFCLVCRSCFYFCVFGRRAVRLSTDVPRTGTFPGLFGEETSTHSCCLAPRSDEAAVARGGEIQLSAVNTRAFTVKQINK